MNTPTQIESPSHTGNNDNSNTSRAKPTFSELLAGNPLLAAVERLGFTTPTPVQQLTLPSALEKRDLIIQAQTGSGKTLAFMLPLLSALRQLETETRLNFTFGLIIAPTRELALQIADVARSLEPDCEPVVLIGGVDMNSQHKALERNPRLVIGTPGRILDQLRQRTLRLNRCQFFVLDEADEMLSMGFLQDVRAILSRLPDGRQGMFVSATITGRVEMLANSFLEKPEVIVVSKPEVDLPPIEHFYCEVGGDLMAKPAALCDLIETFRPSSTIVFCNTKSDTQLVEARLRRRGFEARRINSDLSQKQRDRVMAQIRKGDLPILVATDIAARGLDMDQIELVVNYAIHDQPETYVHRTGRTGRAGRTGKAISLIGPRDFGAFHFLTKVLPAQFKKLTIPSEDDIADARLAHVYELLRKSRLEVKDRDLSVARKFLAEMGGVDSPSEEFEQFTAKLCLYLVEHSLLDQAKSLDEELDSAPPEERTPDVSSSNTPRRDTREDRKHTKERDRQSARHESESRRSAEAESGRSSRNRPENRGSHREPQHRREAPEHGRRSSARDDLHRDSPQQRESNYNRENYKGVDQPQINRSREHSEPLPEELRLYISQGRLHGMSDTEFIKLAVELGQLSKDDLRRLTIRERYGMVDLDREKAQLLVNNLSGVEINGRTLTVEIAANLTPSR